MIELTTLHRLVTIVDAAATAAGAGALIYALGTSPNQQRSGRRALVVLATVGATYVFLAALLALGHGVFFTERAGIGLPAGGQALLAAVLGTGAGIVLAGLEDSVPNVEWSRLRIARRYGLRLFFGFVALGLLVLAPRSASLATPSFTARHLVPFVAFLAVCVAIALTARAHVRQVTRSITWTLIIGLPLLAAFFIANDVPVARAFQLSVASAVVWAPAIGLLIWALRGAEGQLSI
jgi:hypothetical protein